MTRPPIKKILHLQDIKNDTQFNTITREIDEMYHAETPFWMLIETKQVRDIKLRYLYQFGNYLNQLKKRGTRETPQLLQYTIIHVYDDFIYNLLYTLFTFISSPIAKVKVIYYNGGYETIPTEQQSIKKIKDYFP